LLDALIAARQRFRRAASAKPKLAPLDTTVQYRRCPLCEHLMQRRNFARQSGIIVDVCTEHGVWFDAWELQRVLAYVEAGGVAEARRHTLGLPSPQTLEEQRQSAKAVAAALLRGKPDQGLPSSAQDGWWEVFESGVEALSEMGSWLRKLR
jgi:Zn-finger nucleic acid-binding protein